MPLINKKTILAITLTSFLGLQACQNNSKTDQKALQAQVMKTHDALMEDMSILMKNKTSLTAMMANMQQLKQKNSEIDTNLLKRGVQEAQEGLVKSDDAMMTWMNNFNPDYTNKSDAEVITYLKDQKSKIDSVETSFKQSIARSSALLIKFQ